MIGDDVVMRSVTVLVMCIASIIARVRDIVAVGINVIITVSINVIINAITFCCYGYHYGYY